MVVRAFTTSDILDCATGALATNTFGTQAALVKRASTGSWHTFLALHSSGGTALTQFAYSNANVAVLWANDNPVTGPAAVGTAAWGLVVVRKGSGSAIPRFSIYDFTAATWAHGAGSGSMANWTAPGASGTVRFRWQSFDQFAGRIAVRGAWNSLPWAATTGGDAAIEAAGLHTSLQSWIDAAPSALWSFDQAVVTEAVADLTGGGANQTTRTGTTVVSGDDPPGFSFALGGEATQGELAGTVASPSGSLVAVSVASGVLSGLVSPPSGSLTATGTSSGSLAGVVQAPVGSLQGGVSVGGLVQGVVPAPTSTLTGVARSTGVLSGSVPLPVGTLTDAQPLLGPPVVSGPDVAPPFLVSAAQEVPALLVTPPA